MRPVHVANPLVVMVHDEAASEVRNPFEQELIVPILRTLASGMLTVICLRH